ncbi:MAG: DUF2007 domain-containing protein [Anaerolineales bacterium]|jgi:hypothetical protein
MSEDLIKVATAAGKVEAEILRSLLEANEIHVYLSYESAGSAYAMGVGPLAEVDIMVKPEQQAQAEALLDDYYEGRLEDDSTNGDE